MSFWKKVKKGAYAIGDAVAAPINAAEKGLYKAGDFIAQNTGLDKSPISIPIAPALKSILQAPKEIAIGLGDVFAGSGSKGLNRISQALMNPVAKTAEVISSPMGALIGMNPINDNTTPGKKSDIPLPPELDTKTKKLPSKNYGTSAETMMDRAEARAPEGVASGGSGILAIPDVSEEDLNQGIVQPVRVAGVGDIIDPATLARIRANLERAGSTVADKAAQTGRAIRDTFAEGNDPELNTRTFWFRFNNVASQKEIEDFRKAYAAGDKREMDRLRKVMEDRQKGGR